MRVPLLRVSVHSVICFFCLVGLVPEIGHADDAQGDTAKDQTPLGEIIVVGRRDPYQTPKTSTATRTDTDVIDIPQSVEIVPRQVIEDQQVVRLDEALNNVSGVNLGALVGNLSLRFTLRGFSNAPIFLDGFPQYGGYTTGLPEISGLERIDVLKGPSSLLFGQAEPGGIINLVSKSPLAEPLYLVEVEGGSYDFSETRFDVSDKLNDSGTLRYRVNGMFQYYDSFRLYSEAYRRGYIAPSVSWAIDDATDLTLRAAYNKDTAPEDDGLPAYGTTVLRLPNNPIIEDNNNNVTGYNIVAGYDLTHRFNDAWRVTNAFRFSERQNTIMGLIADEFEPASFTEVDFKGLQNVDNVDYGMQTYAVGDFATGPITHTLLFGVDAYHYRSGDDTGADFFNLVSVDLQSPVRSALLPSAYANLPIVVNYVLTGDRLGYYIQDQMALLENLKLLAGVRYDHSRDDTSNEPTEFGGASRTTLREDGTSPRVGIVYEPTSHISVYGNFSRSFNPSTTVNFEGNPLAPEMSKGYEAGVKTELAEKRLQTTLAFFDVTKDNVATPDPSNPLNTITTGAERSRGVEFDMLGQIVTGWNVIASYANINAITTADSVIRVGNSLYNSPKNSGSIWTTYAFQDAALKGWDVGGGVQFVGTRFGDNANTYTAPAYTVFNATIAYRQEKWRAAINVKNLFDRYYIADTQNARDYSNDVGQPRTVIGSLTYSF